MAWLNTPKSTWIALVFAVGLITATWYPGLDERFHRDPAGTVTAVGDAANLSFSLKDLVTGRNVSLVSYRGKILILNFFATWCVPCKVETPDLVALQAKYPDEVAVIGILWFDEEGRAKTPAFGRSLGVTYPLVDGNGIDALDTAFGPIDGLPRSIVIAPDGRISAIQDGAARRTTFERLIQEARQ